MFYGYRASGEQQFCNGSRREYGKNGTIDVVGVAEKLQAGYYLVVLQLAHSVCARHDIAKSKDVSKALCRDVFVLHSMDRCCCLFDILDAGHHR